MVLFGEAPKMSFITQMRELEQEFAAAAAVHGDVYLPNFTPSGPVDAVLIGMEPSLGWWARTPAEAAAKIAAGFRNFMWSPEDFILHYAARRSLCSAAETYHVTDISKGAMTVKLPLRSCEKTPFPAPCLRKPSHALRKAKLSESRKKLAFIYSTVFAKLRAA